MKKICYKLKGVDCANCAIKIEDKVSKLNEVFYGEYTFMTERLNVLFDENTIVEDKIEDVIINTIVGVKIVKKLI